MQKFVHKKVMRTFVPTMTRSSQSGISPKIQTFHKNGTGEKRIKEDEISLLMLLNQIQMAEYTQKVKERNMGYLWENMEKMDMQAERRMRAEAQEKQAEAERRLAEAEEKLTEAEQKQAEAQKTSEDAIRLLSEMGMDEQAERRKLKEMEHSDKQ